MNHKIIEHLAFNLDGKTRDADEFHAHVAHVLCHLKHKSQNHEGGKDLQDH